MAIGGAIVRIRLYDVIERCVREGVEAGFRKAHHRPAPPSQAELMEDVSASVMEEFQQWFVFDKPEGVFAEPEG